MRGALPLLAMAQVTVTELTVSDDLNFVGAQVENVVSWQV
jgi:hypothetical protein